MFRALLWKEWRELWILPVVAVPLAVMSFFGTKAATLREMSVLPESSLTMPAPLSPVVWDTSFALWLLLAAIYIPTHLYAREKDLNTSVFLRTMPLDRFRLWWFRLLIGITAMAGVALTLWAIITILKLFHQTSPNFGSHATYIMMASGCAALILFSLSSFFSSLFRRQFSAIAGVIFVLLLFGAIVWIGWKLDQGTSVLDSFPTYTTPSLFILLGKFSLTRNLDYLSILLLILCPSFLFLSLAAFAKGNMARQSPRRIALTYTLLAIVALSPVSLGFSRLLAGVDALDWTLSDSFQFQGVSSDGTRILLKRTQQKLLRGALAKGHYALPKKNWGGNSIVLVDLKEGRIRTIEKNRIFRDLDITAHFTGIRGEANKILLYKMHRGKLSRIFPERITLVDLEESWEKDIFSEYRSDETRGQGAYASWSPDGTYFALIKRPPKDTSEEAYIALSDSSGNLIGKHIIPTSRGSELWTNGWDYRSRLYFTQYSTDPSPLITCRRISPDNMIPEEIPNAPFENYSIYGMSPGGRRMVLVKRSDSDEEWKYGVYDIARETYQPIAEDAVRMYYFRWSPDSRMLAYAVPADPPPGMEEKKRVWFSKLFLYDVETGTSRPVSDKPLANFSMHTWSPSGGHLLFSHKDLIEGQSDTGETIFVAKEPTTHYVLAAGTGQITEVSYPFEFEDLKGYPKGYLLRWISEDKIIWFDREKLIATEPNGSNPQEIFRIEDGRYYLCGEEQS